MLNDFAQISMLILETIASHLADALTWLIEIIKKLGAIALEFVDNAVNFVKYLPYIAGGLVIFAGVIWYKHGDKIIETGGKVAKFAV